LTIINNISIPIKSQDLIMENKAFLNEGIWINANSTQEEFRIINGFLHGRDENSIIPNSSLVSKLKSQNWKLYKYNSYQIAQQHGSNITYGLADHYAWSQGGFPDASPWENWSYYENYILMIMQYYDYYFPEYPVKYYAIWNEPDHSYYWHGTYQQLLELYYRAYNVIKNYNPEAKIVGPNIAWYRPGYPGVQGIFNFLVDLDTMYGIKLDAISWHENGGTSYDTRTDGIPTRANYLRYQIESYFPSNYKPEYHVNEYMGKLVHLSPGWNVGFLYYLHEANIDAAMRACWWIYSLDPYDYWCDCWWGLNGMFMKDGETPQSAYWINKKYADMDGLIILNTSSNDNYVNTIATINETNNIIHALIGRYYQTDTQNVIVQINNYYYDDEVIIKIEYLENYPEFYTDPPQAIPVPEGPTFVSFDIYPVINNTIQIDIVDFYDGDAYIIVGYPKSYPTLYLVEGWNLVTIPFNMSWYASDISFNISNCLSISGWDSINQTYKTFIVGGPPSFDFEILDGYGYFIDNNLSDILIISGNQINSINISMNIGWNLIGWYHDYNSTASSLAENLTGCISVSCWDAINQTYKTYIVGGPPSFDFSVSRGMGLFVDVITQSYWHGEG
jgi:hypothetical protein